MTFSRDPQETYIYVVDCVNEKVYILQRSTLEVLTSFGDAGRQPGQFFDGAYTGARVQRFLYKGLAPVSKTDQGVAWPRP